MTTGGHASANEIGVEYRAQLLSYFSLAWA